MLWFEWDWLLVMIWDSILVRIVGKCFAFCGFERVDVLGGLRNGVKAWAFWGGGGGGSAYACSQALNPRP